MFSLVLTEDYLCGYVMPLCDEKFKNLPVEDFIRKILIDKPDLIKQDDFLDKIYAKISAEHVIGHRNHSYRVLSISDWHLDLEYLEGTIKKNCQQPLCC